MRKGFLSSSILIFILLGACSGLKKKLNKQVVFDKKVKKARYPAHLGLPYKIKRKAYSKEDQEFAQKCMEKGGRFKYSGCYCGHSAINPFVDSCQ